MTPNRETIRIFVSSPGDVSSERFVAEKVIKRLQEEFTEECVLEPIFWEHEPLTATASFQEELISPAVTDIVVCILWSRLGTRLPKKVAGDRHLTGTEYEFEEAFKARSERGYPHLLVYRKTARPIADLSDRQRRREAVEQIEALEAFIDRWFHDEAGALIAAFHPFDDSATFEDNLAHHLRKLIERRLGERGIKLGSHAGPPPSWFGASPFRGLAVFEPEHAPIFCGRTKAIGEAIDQLKRLAAMRRAFLLILGSSGCGKSSLVRAGMIPLLTQPNVIEGVRECRYVLVRPSSAQGDLFLMLATAVAEALPELLRDGTGLAELAESMRHDAKLTVALIKGALNLAASQSESSPEARLPRICLLLVVDQLEELFTLYSDRPQVLSQFAELLHELACHPMSRTLVIATLRSDFYHHLLQQPKFAEMQAETAQYVLQAPSISEITQIIRMPAQAAGLRFDQDSTGASLDDVLRDEAARDPSVLPLLEFALDELYRMADGARLLRFEDYTALGGVAGALARRAEEVFVSQSADVQAAFPAVFRELVAFNNASDDSPTSCAAQMTKFTTAASHKRLVDVLVNARMLVSDRATDGSVIVRVAHESLLARWSRLAEWLKQNQRLLKVRDQVVSAAARWLTEARGDDFLLPSGKPLIEAEELLTTDMVLSSDSSRFISASQSYARRQKFRWKALQAAVVAVILIGSAVSIKFGLDASENSKIVEKQATEVATTNEKLDQANQALNSSLARALRGSIGTGELLAASDAEIESLQELASLRTKLDTTKFLNDFTLTLDSTARLAKRAEFVLQATIACDREQRRKFEELMLKKLREADLPQEQLSELAMVWYKSECVNSVIDEIVAPILFDRLQQKGFKEHQDYLAFSEIAGRLNSDKGRPLLEKAAKQVYETLSRKRNRLVGLQYEAYAYALLSKHLPSEDRAQCHNVIAEGLSEAVKASPEWYEKNSLSHWISPLAAAMKDQSGPLLESAAETLLRELDNGTDAVKYSQIAGELAAIAHWLPREDANRISNLVCRRLITESLATTNASAADSFAGGLCELGRYMSVDVLRDDLNRLLSLTKWATVVGSTAQALAEAIDVLELSDARELSIVYAPELVSRFRRAKLGSWSPFITRALAKMLPHLDQTLQKELMDLLSTRLQETIPKSRSMDDYDWGFWAKSVNPLIPWIESDTLSEFIQPLDEMLLIPDKLQEPTNRLSKNIARTQSGDLAECRLKIARIQNASDVDRWREYVALNQLNLVAGLFLSPSTMPDYPPISMSILQDNVIELRKRLEYVLLDYDQPLPVGLLQDFLNHPFCVSIARQTVLDALGRQTGRNFKDHWEAMELTQ